MRQDCDCSFCKSQVNEYFCGKCLHNFNECEAYHEYRMPGTKGLEPGIFLCPICNPKDDVEAQRQIHWSQTKEGEKQLLDILNDTFWFQPEGKIIRKKSKWKIYQDRDDQNDEIDSYTITNNECFPGWDTDSGYAGYGLPKDLAQWICERLNKCDEPCPFYMNDYGDWEKVLFNPLPERDHE